MVARVLAAAFACVTLLSGCATATLSLSNADMASLRITGVDVVYAPTASIWWGRAEREYAEPKLELHPHLARQHGIADGDWVTIESRRGRMTVRCQVVTTIRPDVVFVPYHWAGAKSVNRVTISAQDPISKIPEYKVCAVRIKKAEEPEYAKRLEPQQ